MTTTAGLYALIASSVDQRTHEIGVRVAIGASHRDLRSLVLAEALGPLAGGAVIGTLLSFWLARSLDALLYSVGLYDASTTAGALAFCASAAAVAVSVSTRRILRMDVAQALRAE